MDSKMYPRIDAVVVTNTAAYSLSSESEITRIARVGRIARLRVDWLNIKWDYTPRSVLMDGLLSNPPHTVTFNEALRDSKGSKIPLTWWMRNYLRGLNTEKAFFGLLDPKAGWINTSVYPETLSFAGNDVVVLGTSGRYSNVYAIDCNNETLAETWNTPNGRLVIHKFNAVTPKKTMIKLGAGMDAYIPFIKNSLSYWIRSDYLETFPALPFKLMDGSVVIEYLLLGDETWGITKSGKVCLYNPRDKYTTNWKLENPSPP